MTEKIAVVGLSSLYPGAIDTKSFWNNIVEGKDSFSDVPADHWLIEDYYDKDPTVVGKMYAKRGAFLPKVDFSPLEFGIPPKVLSQTDTVQLLSLLVAKKVLQDTESVQSGKVDRKDISVILGIASATELVGQMSGSIQHPNWIKALRENGIPESQVQKIRQDINATYVPWTENTFPGLLGNVVAGRIANRFDLGGTNCVIDAACASSLSALAMAIQELQLGHCDLALTGGADALNDIFMYMCFGKTTALSFSGDCRPFSKNADGTMLGEGVGMLALRRLEDAKRDNDKIYAVICGLGSSSDGKSKSVYAPRAEGQALAIERAYQRAGYSPDDVDLVEAHGTGTIAGDAAEFKGLQLVFNTKKRKKQTCALGSIKSQIGHTKAAAGAASLVKIIMALHHKTLPPTIKVDEPNPDLDIENSPFYLNTKARPWVHSPTSPRRASVSSFGFGGSNFHVALEEYQGKEQRKCFLNSKKHLILFSSDDIETFPQKIKKYLEKNSIEEMARYSQRKFSPLASRRLALIAEDKEQIQDLFTSAYQKITLDQDKSFSLPYKMHYSSQKMEGQVGYLFSGQGSQYLNMGRELAINFSSCREVWDLAASLSLDLENSLHEVVFPKPAFSQAEENKQKEKLTSTQWAQPAIGAVSVGQLRLLENLGINASCFAGHSYGELTALYASGCISSLEDFFKISRRRGELMAQAAKEPGAMTAVLASVEKTKQFLSETNSLVIANMNSPKQTVVAGKVEKIILFEKSLQQKNIPFRRLPVATAFHSSLVESSSPPFRAYLNEFLMKVPQKTTYSNTSSNPYPADENQTKDILSEQLARPVKFLQQINNMYKEGVRLFLEIGPGKTLTKLVQECLGEKEHYAISMDDQKKEGMESLWNALGELSVLGLDMNFDKLWENFAQKEAEAVKKSSAVVKINGANFNKPYPPEGGAMALPAANPEAVSTEKKPSSLVQTAKPSQSKSVTLNSFESRQENVNMSTENSKPKEPSSLPGHQWLQAFQQIQHNALEVQKFYQKTLSDSHMAFLQFSESAIGQLGSSGNGSSAGEPAKSFSRFRVEPLAQTKENPYTSPVEYTSPVAYTSPKPEVSPVAANTSSVVYPETSPAVYTESPNKTPENTPLMENAVPVAETSTESNESDLQQIFLQIVAEKTGYEEDVIEIDMDMESDLGIDSIKRVEILSDFQEKYPQMAQIDLKELEALHTLREIIDFVRGATEKKK